MVLNEYETGITKNDSFTPGTITALFPGDDDDPEDDSGDWTDIDDEDFEDMAQDKDDFHEMQLENNLYDPEDDDHLPEDED